MYHRLHFSTHTPSLACRGKCDPKPQRKCHQSRFTKSDFVKSTNSDNAVTSLTFRVYELGFVSQLCLTLPPSSSQMFLGNSEPDEEMLNLFDPPLFARFIRIHPRGWVNDIALRLEFMGCDTQQRLWETETGQGAPLCSSTLRPTSPLSLLFNEHSSDVMIMK